MAHAVARLVPFVLFALACAAFLIAPGIDGPALVVVWLLIFGIERAVVAMATTRDARLAMDAILLVGCLLAAFEGGWYLVPSAVAFLWIDRRSVSPSGPTMNRVDHETIAGIAAGLGGLAGVAAILVAPMWMTASSAIGAGGVLDGAAQPGNLLGVGLLPRTTIFLGAATILSIIVAGSAVVHGRRGGRTPSRVLGLSVVGLAAIAVLGAFTVGVFLLPAVALGTWAWFSGRRSAEARQ
jgi:hypothetical protein